VSLLLAVSLLLQAGAYPGDLAAGQLLVASEKSRDPDFAKTVVLLIQFDNHGAAGLILNRRLKGGQDAVYAGGPLALGMHALLRSRIKPEESTHLFADVYLVSGEKLVKKMSSSGARPASFRVFAGYAGWTQQQLKNEVAAGLWHVLSGDSALVFDANADSMWSRQMARGLRRAN